MSESNALTMNDIAKTRLRAWLKILKTANLIEKNIREKLRENFDTTLPRFDVMAALARSEKGMKMSQLSGVLKVSNGNVTGIIDRLVKDEFVKRVAVEGDRRALLVRLTDKGRAEFNKYAAAHEIWLNDMLSDLNEVDAETLIGLLSVISEGDE